MLTRSTSLTMLFTLLALSLCTAFSPAARADDPLVTFAGEVDSDGPLVIDPSSADDPQTLTVTNTNTNVYFIERMPQTKWVTSITLGDFGRGTCSSSAPTARLYVFSHEDNDFNGASSQLSYGPEVALPATPGRLTFTFDWTSSGNGALLMRKDKAYTFGIQISGCDSFRQTTWAPLESKMETPARSCISALPFGPSGYLGTKMAWHDAVTPADPGCVAVGQDFWGEEPDGWLVSVTPGWSPMIDMIQNIPDDPTAPSSHHCESTYAGQNISQVNVWLPTGNPVMQLDGVCRYNSFSPPGQESRYTWSTALPWRAETGGGPRLSYLKLDTPDWDNTLLQQFAPAMKYDSDEDFLLQDARGIASIGAGAADCSDGANGLGNRSITFDPTIGPVTTDRRYTSVSSAACPVAGGLTMDVLRPEGTKYPFTVDGEQRTVVARDGNMGDHLSERGDEYSKYSADSGSVYAVAGWRNHMYGRVVHGTGGDLWLQYFFWYYYNDGGTRFDGVDDHEGDWEGIQVHIPNPMSANPVPDRATYNEHAFRSVCAWGLVERADGHPVVYVSAGRHASYFTPEKMPSQTAASGDGTDASPLTPGIVSHVEAITAYTPGWVRWPGMWGDSTGDLVGGGTSPTGPATFHLWKDPAAWDSDEEASGKASDIACPDNPPPAARLQAEKLGTRQERTHRTKHDGTAPTVRWKRLADGRIRVHWKLPKPADADHVAVRLQLGIHATEILWPASVVRVDVTDGKRSGTATVDLPGVKGPYELVGRIIQRNGQWSDEATSPIPAG